MKTLIQCIYKYIPIPRIIPSNIPVPGGSVPIRHQVDPFRSWRHGTAQPLRTLLQAHQALGILGDPGDNIPHTVGMA